MSTGFRVFLKRELPPKDLVEAFKKIPAANIADCMNRIAALNSRIHLVTKPTEENMVGVALTVKARPGDNLMIHKALNISQPGDVIVVANEGDSSHSLLGDIMANYAKSRGVSGIVFDGPIRDIDTIYTLGIPMYATGTTPGGPYKEGPGEVNVPVACGGMMVDPGDIIVGDQDGVIVIPRNDAAEILEAALKFKVNDDKKCHDAATGNAKRGWVEQRLSEKGCEIIDDIYRP